MTDRSCETCVHRVVCDAWQNHGMSCCTCGPNLPLWRGDDSAVVEALVAEIKNAIEVSEHGSQGDAIQSMLAILEDALDALEARDGDL